MNAHLLLYLHIERCRNALRIFLDCSISVYYESNIVNANTNMHVSAFLIAACSWAAVTK